MWDKIIGDVTNNLPPFNDFLLKKYRDEKMGEIVENVDAVFKESMHLFKRGNSEVSYLGYEELSPKERAEYHVNNKIRRCVEIKKNSARLIRCNFEFSGEKVAPVVTEVPYLEDGCVWSNGTRYFPQLPIVEKGGCSVIGNEIKLKVMRAVLSFRRSVRDLIRIKTVEGDVFRDVLILTRIHQGMRSRKVRTPLILYSLASYGFDATLFLLGFEDGELTLTKDVVPDEDWYHVPIGNQSYMRFKTSTIKDLVKRRFIASFISITSFVKKWELEELTNSTIYYISTLGAYTSPSTKSSNVCLRYTNAETLLNNCKTLLDIPTRLQLQKIGIFVQDLQEFIIYVFKNIDDWIVNYDPCDLFSKKISSLRQLLSVYTERVFSKQYRLISHRRRGVDRTGISGFINTASKQLNWYLDNQIFSANPSVYNDNWLLTIGAKRFRSLNNIETKTRGDSAKGSKKGSKPSVSLVKSHPSQLIVESIIALPSSSPVITGSINPYLQIDVDGNIIKPDWFDEELGNVFEVF